MTTPSFTFRHAATTNGLVTSGDNDGTLDVFHPLLPMTLHAASGFLVILNGYNLNRCLTEGTTSADIRMLQMRAPRESILPLVSMPGEGRIFRPKAKYRYSWEDSTSGRQSGLSPIPTTYLNLGVETPASTTTFVGQRVWFYIATTGKPIGADTINLWANTASEDETWYLADSQPIGSSSYVLLSDNSTDEELQLQPYVVDGTASAIPAGMSWSEGVMPPLCRAWTHPSGRVFYYGIRRFGRTGIRPIRASVTQGSDLVSLIAGTGSQRIIEAGRVSQRIRFYSDASGTAIVDPTVYRFLKSETAATFRIYPEIQTSTTVASGATVSLYYEIEDDRDARWTWMSEPNKPWLIDPLKILAAGDDFDDGVMAWFALGGRIFMQTKRALYEALGGVTEDPSRSTIFQQVANEGMTGFDAGCVTPFGWVFVHETKGVRLFNGSIIHALGGDADPFQEFLPRTQFNNFDPAGLESALCVYDPEAHAVCVSYVPLGQGCRKEVLFYSAAERIWRGPYRDVIAAAGKMRGTGSSDVLAIGDEYGNLLVREAQALDVMPTVTSFTGTGTVSSVQTARLFTDASGTTFDADSDERLRGSPIWFTDGTYYYFARIADVFGSTNQLELDGPPVREDGTAATLTAGWSFSVGALRWSLTTAYVDTNRDPAKPMEAMKLDVRFKRGVTSSDSFEVAASENASGTFSGVRTATGVAAAASLTTDGRVHGEMRLKREGALVQLRVRGLSTKGDPQITRAILLGEERDGALKQ